MVNTIICHRYQVSIYRTIVGRRVEIQCLQWFYAAPLYSLTIHHRTKMRHYETSPLDLSCATSYVTVAWISLPVEWTVTHVSSRVHLSLHLVTYARIKKKKKKKEKKTRKNTSYRQTLTSCDVLIRYNTTRCKNLHFDFSRCHTKSSCLRERDWDAIERSMQRGIRCKRSSNCASYSVWHNKEHRHGY